MTTFVNSLVSEFPETYNAISTFITEGFEDYMVGVKERAESGEFLIPDPDKQKSAIRSRSRQILSLSHRYLKAHRREGAKFVHSGDVLIKFMFSIVDDWRFYDNMYKSILHLHEGAHVSIMEWIPHLWQRDSIQEQCTRQRPDVAALRDAVFAASPETANWAVLDNPRICFDCGGACTEEIQPDVIREDELNEYFVPTMVSEGFAEKDEFSRGFSRTKSARKI